MQKCTKSIGIYTAWYTVRLSCMGREGGGGWRWNSSVRGQTWTTTHGWAWWPRIDPPDEREVHWQTAERNQRERWRGKAIYDLGLFGKHMWPRSSLNQRPIMLSLILLIISNSDPKCLRKLSSKASNACDSHVLLEKSIPLWIVTYWNGCGKRRNNILSFLYENKNAHMHNDY